MGGMIVEAFDARDAIKHSEARARDAKRPYHKPELTKYQQLTEITLGIQCSGTFPPCSPQQDPFE